jgi:hypothetical protein
MTEQRPARAPGRPREVPPASRLHVIAVRVPAEMLRRLEAYRAQAQTAQPYVRLSRADIIRTLLDKALSAIATPPGGLSPPGGPLRQSPR